MKSVYLCISESGGVTDERIAVFFRKVFNCEMPRIARTELGKPYFPDRPDLHVSVSHSGRYFVCALSGAPVGVDIQEHVLRRGETVDTASARLIKTARRFFHPDEVKFIENDTFERFFRVWTAKESFVKYTGKGIGSDFSQLCAISAAMSPLDTHTPSSWQTDSAHFLQMKPDDNYTLCICSPEEFELIII